VPADGEQLRPAALLRPERLVGLAPVEDDPRHGGQRLDVIDHRRPAVEPDHRREGRLEARVAALALERFEQRRLLAADVGPRAGVHVEVALEARAEDVRTQVAALVGLRHGALQNLLDVPVLAADVDVVVARAEGVGGDDHALDQLVRVVTHEVTVLARPRLRLVGVADDVLRPLRLLRDEPPLHPGRETGPAPPAE
jgi:hypothetical protein